MTSAKPTPVPRPPFDRWPLHVYDRAFGFAWWAQPAAFVTQATIEKGTLEAAQLVQDWMDACLRERADEAKAAGGIFVFHDWMNVSGYTSEGRQHYLGRMRSRPKDYLRHSVTCIRPSPLFRMAVEAGNLVAAMTARARVELSDAPATALALHGLQPPPPRSKFPGSR